MSIFFLSATKIATLLKAQFKDLEISEINIRRFLIQKGYKWKYPIQRVKMKLNKKLQDCNFENTIKKLEQCIFHWWILFLSHGISRWVHKNENNSVEKSKYAKKIHVWGAFWSNGVIKLIFWRKYGFSKVHRYFRKFLWWCELNFALWMDFTVR